MVLHVASAVQGALVTVGALLLTPASTATYKYHVTISAVTIAVTHCQNILYTWLTANHC